MRRLGDWASGLVGWALTGFVLAGLIHHVVICLSEGRWAMLVLGVLILPVGVIHGWGRYFLLW